MNEPRELTEIYPADLTDTELKVLVDTRRWLEHAVIGLNLCPFAKSVHVKKQIRYVISRATDEGQLLDEMIQEFRLLADTPAAQLDTTLLVHPLVLTDFAAYNNFLAIIDMTLTQMRWQGTFQVASLHPDYVFADVEADDVSNYTNRSPFPTLHLLREASIDRAVAAFPNPESIYERNIETLQRIGADGWRALLSADKA